MKRNFSSFNNSAETIDCIEKKIKIDKIERKKLIMEKYCTEIMKNFLNDNKSLFAVKLIIMSPIFCQITFDDHNYNNCTDYDIDDYCDNYNDEINYFMIEKIKEHVNILTMQNHNMIVRYLEKYMILNFWDSLIIPKCIISGLFNFISNNNIYSIDNFIDHQEIYNYLLTDLNVDDNDDEKRIKEKMKQKLVNIGIHEIVNFLLNIFMHDRYKFTIDINIFKKLFFIETSKNCNNFKFIRMIENILNYKRFNYICNILMYCVYNNLYEHFDAILNSFIMYNRRNVPKNPDELETMKILSTMYSFPIFSLFTIPNLESENSKYDNAFFKYINDNIILGNGNEKYFKHIYNVVAEMKRTNFYDILIKFEKKVIQKYNLLQLNAYKSNLVFYSIKYDNDDILKKIFDSELFEKGYLNKILPLIYEFDSVCCFKKYIEYIDKNLIYFNLYVLLVFNKSSLKIFNYLYEFNNKKNDIHMLIQSNIDGLFINIAKKDKINSFKLIENIDYQFILNFDLLTVKFIEFSSYNCFRHFFLTYLNNDDDIDYYQIYLLCIQYDFSEGLEILHINNRIVLNSDTLIQTIENLNFSILHYYNIINIKLTQKNHLAFVNKLMNKYINYESEYIDDNGLETCSDEYLKLRELLNSGYKFFNPNIIISKFRNISLNNLDLLVEFGYKINVHDFLKTIKKYSCYKNKSAFNDCKKNIMWIFNKIETDSFIFIFSNQNVFDNVSNLDSLKLYLKSLFEL